MPTPTEKRIITQEEMRAKFEARKKWLDTAPEVPSTLEGHAHGTIATIEAGFSENYKDLDGLSPTEYWEKGAELIQEKWNVDVRKLPDEHTPLTPIPSFRKNFPFP